MEGEDRCLCVPGRVLPRLDGVGVIVHDTVEEEQLLADTIVPTAVRLIVVVAEAEAPALFLFRLG